MQKALALLFRKEYVRGSKGRDLEFEARGERGALDGPDREPDWREPRRGDEERERERTAGLPPGNGMRPFARSRVYCFSVSRKM